MPIFHDVAHALLGDVDLVAAARVVREQLAQMKRP
jgi:hypothetical protein